MYFPYLRNRNSEQLAIKSLLSNQKLNNTIPILATSFIDPRLDVSNRGDVNKYILRKFKIVKDLILLKKDFILLFDDSLSHASISIEYIHKFLIQNLQLNETIFDSLCTYGVNDYDLNNIETKSFVKDRDIAIFYNNEPVQYPSFNIKYNILINQNFILVFVSIPIDNKIVITDSFKAQDSNKNYPKFDEFPTYSMKYNKYNLFGFGDYTSLRANFVPPRQVDLQYVTVAIHLTFYSELSQNTYIAHYLCEPYEEVDFNPRVAGALNKLKDDTERFEETLGLKILLDTDYTSLGKLKELSVAHHIEFMSKY
jgi:hypothetical protein